MTATLSDPVTTSATTGIGAGHARQDVEHLTPERWAIANRHVLRKALSEFAHERLIVPIPEGNNSYLLASDDGAIEYRFTARRLQLDHWAIDGASIHRTRRGTVPSQGLALDVLDFITEFRGTLGVREDMLPLYLEEISSTLASHAYKQLADRPCSAELAKGVSAGVNPAADFQMIEMAMTEGHPCFVANNGRMGFGITDYRGFAPEAGAPVRLQWLAVHHSKAVFSASAGLEYRAHFEAELGAAALANFDSELTALSVDPADYLLMPVHPWQWENKLAVTFAAEIALRHLIPLSRGSEDYQAQQSIRTFFNTSTPERCYVKTALSVLNMGFMRGLSPAYMKATPAINDWLFTLIGADQTLMHHGLTMIREKAALGYHNAYFEAASIKGSPYRQMLSALWRESPLPLLGPGQQLATMASLLHVDGAGVPLASELIRRSGLGATQWLRRYLHAYLVPVVHCLFRYELAFMPHGENVILVLEHGVPVRAIMKDIGEEIALMGDDVEVPDEVSRIKVAIPEGERVLAVFTDVFDCIFRFLAATLVEDGALSEDEFWGTVAAVVHGYQSDHPELAEAFARHDLFADEFDLSCLNRLQLRNNKNMLDLGDPSGGLQMAGKLANPLAAFR
ncbi:Siderophore synthetase component [Arthrobacter alpinus]|uniref:Siderophore synthetase component n=1 Tax=Arthrobacter alpinus TaxID=656366 RepID=A0A1H5JNQ8_9MICC|nr:IucA/IucC family siderophore biosynthesis protein [Arthrobacter alpinus]SEE53258.1 Siderophore synthetase component [Arthrobacter alpinus]